VEGKTAFQEEWVTAAPEASRAVEIRLLQEQDGAVLDRVAPGVFDRDVAPRWRDEFFADPRHHLVVAVEADVVVGFVSAVHYVHPDKPPELWINEVGVAPSHQRLGVGRRLLDRMLARGAELGCIQAWVLTSPGNTAARRLYASAGGQAAAEPSIMFEFPMAGFDRLGGQPANG
jgi:ribosomal protein S18 acetylase RimI-like enzyme